MFFFNRRLYLTILAFFFIWPTNSFSQTDEFDTNKLIPVVDLLLNESQAFSCPKVSTETTLTRATPLLLNSQSGIDALEGITKIIGDVRFTSNLPFRYDISALQSLVEIDGNVTASAGVRTASNDNGNGFNCLQTVTGDFEPPNSFDGRVYSEFKSLTTVGGNLGFSFSGIDNFSDLEPFKAVTSVDSLSLRLVSVRGISSDFLGSLTTINSNLSITFFNMDEFPPISIFESINSLQHLGISGEPIPAFSNLTTAQSLTVVGAVDIPDTSLVALNTIRGNLTISLGLQGRSLTGFPSLTSVGGRLNIFNTNNLVEINGFPALTTVGNNLDFMNLRGLEAINGFESLESVGGLRVLNNSRNADNLLLGGFPVLNFVNGNFIIDSNPGLQAITGFPSLSLVTGDLTIESNIGLETITGFDSLTSDGIQGLTLILNNILFDCTDPAPNFTPILTDNPFEVSMGNLVNCD